jgi:UV DNA damage repair endonuclease
MGLERPRYRRIDDDATIYAFDEAQANEAPQVYVATVMHTCTRTIIRHVLTEHLLPIAQQHVENDPHAVLEIIDYCAKADIPLVTTHRGYKDTQHGWDKRGEGDCAESREMLVELLKLALYNGIPYFVFDFEHPATLDATLDELGRHIGKTFTRRAADWPHIGYRRDRR